MELEDKGDRTSTRIKEKCETYLDYIIPEIARLQLELLETL